MFYKADVKMCVEYPLLLRINSFPFPLSVAGLPSSFIFSCTLRLPQNQFAALNVPKKDNSQIEGPSIANTYGFKISMQNLQDAKALHEVSCCMFRREVRLLYYFVKRYKGTCDQKLS